MRIAIGIVVALLVSGFVRHLLAPSYHVPDTVRGEARIHSAATDRFEHDMIAEGQKDDVTLEAAVYGTGATPDVFFVLANGMAAENTDELFSGFLQGVESAGVSVDRARTITGHHGDAEYRCVPLSGRAIDAAACIWREDASVGLTLDLSPSGDATGALIAAYDATHA